MTGIRVNISDKVAASESRDIEPVPTGKYLVQIDGAELKEVKEGKNQGQMYCNLELTIIDGQYDGRKMWTNIMLFGEAYSAVWLGKALGFYHGQGDLEFPEPGDLLGRKLVVKAVKIGETKDKTDPSKVYAPKNEVKGMWPEGEWTKGPAGSAAPVPARQGSANLLP